MVKLLSVLLGVFQYISKYLADKQLIDAGKAESSVAAVKEVEARVDQANAAVTVPDANRTERLRSRFDRSRSGK